MLGYETPADFGKYIPKEAILISYYEIAVVGADGGGILMGLDDGRVTAAIASSCWMRGIELVAYFYWCNIEQMEIKS